MVMLEQRIQQQFFDSADLKYQSAETLSRPIAAGAAVLIDTITAGGKVFAWGRGAAGLLAQHLAASFAGRFERERPPLAALALDDDSLAIKQLQALGQPGDALVLLESDSSDPAAAVAMVQAAQAKDMTLVVLAGQAHAALRAALSEADVIIAVPHERAARILEMHLLVLHGLCDAVDLQLMGEQDS